MSGPAESTVEAGVLAGLDELRQRRAEAQRVERDVFSELKKALYEASQLRIDGVPINRSLLIEHSGLSRRTAYQILDALSPDET